jgi:hypothetical protein
MTWAGTVATPGGLIVADSTLRLHRQLAAVLPDADLRLVFAAVVGMFNRNFKEAATGRDLRQKSVAVGMRACVRVCWLVSHSICFAPGIVADVLQLEEKLAPLRNVMPLAKLRAGLADTGLVLPSSGPM